MDRKQMASGETEEMVEGPITSIASPTEKKKQLDRYCEYCRAMNGYEYISLDGLERFGQERPQGREYAVAFCRNHQAHEEAKKQALAQPSRAKRAKKK
jgi:hypothetical protein